MAKSKCPVLIDSILSEYDTLRVKKKEIESRMKLLSEDIKDYAEKHGSKNDSGSFYSENDHFIYGKQAKKSVSFKEQEAISFLESHGFLDCIGTKKFINEDTVEQYVLKGDISYSDLESITQTKVTYALDVKQKDSLPEVQETTCEMAASTKPKSVLRRK